MQYVSAKPLTDEDTIRELIVMLASYAATGETMVAAVPCSIKSPIYTDVTMGLLPISKKEGWFFSSCAYLCHWALELAGFANVPGIGRTGKPDQPLSRLAYHALSRPIGEATTYEGGDVIQIGNENRGEVAHVFMALADNESRDDIGPEATGILGAHYGQEGLKGDTDLEPKTPDESIGGIVKLLPIKHVNYMQRIGSRQAMRVLSISALLEHYPNLQPARIPRSLWEWPGFSQLRGDIHLV